MEKITLQEIEHLAHLSRLSLTDTEKEDLAQDLETILSYVGSIQVIDVIRDHEHPSPVRNCLREDENPHEPGTFSQDILDNAPDRDGDYIRVKKVL